MSSDLATRRVDPEILDRLPAGDPRAIGSRRDLARINALMLQPKIMAALLSKHVRQPPRRVLEIGAGDGTFMLSVARRLTRHWPNVELTLLDRMDLVTRECRDGFDKLGWQARPVVADVFEWVEHEGDARFDAITSNLFLHHFSDAELSRLLSRLRPVAPIFIATEPLRATFPLAAARLLWAIAANDVTRHDAAASVRAGFAGSELSDLWGAGTAVEERRAGLFTHAFAVTSGAVTP
ncbi:methyltransferase domain-containing protein [Pseudaminobacter sp. NGMCC 1.201702]|uniref:methyltransferase domain-containing protein n=1 Tax=Pseudaminobacter sp. NGMCC 1.201702 TaxID=3391825 RepID=UPI0039F13F1B